MPGASSAGRPTAADDPLRTPATSYFRDGNGRLPWLALFDGVADNCEMKSEQKDQYLRRIEFSGAVSVDWACLASLQLAHLETVPFENIDVELGTPIVLDPERLFDKIVGRRRGGFCYELNGLFADLLRALGFSVWLLSARVARPDGTFGLPAGHMMVLVELDEPWLVDVGFGDSFIQPLRLRSGIEQTDGRTTYMVLQVEKEWLLLKKHDVVWATELQFSLHHHELADFNDMCVWTQTAQESHFVRNSICTRLTNDGRITLSGQRLIVTAYGQKQEYLVEGKMEREAQLLRLFYVDLTAPDNGKG